MREDTSPAYEATDGVHRPAAAFNITGDIAEKLKTISPAAIDRYLKKDKEAFSLMGKSLTKPLLSLKSRIPLRAFYSSEERKTPGFRQISAVHHCGDRPLRPIYPYADRRRRRLGLDADFGPGTPFPPQQDPYMDF